MSQLSEPVVPLPMATYATMVLLVDDQAIVAEALRRALAEQDDIDFHYCTDSSEALDLAVQIRPTVILQDLVMPGVDGCETAQRIRKIEDGDNRPRLIAVTADVSAPERIRCLQSGMNDFLTKPVRVEDIAAVLEFSAAKPHESVP